MLNFLDYAQTGKFKHNVRFARGNILNTFYLFLYIIIDGSGGLIV